MKAFSRTLAPLLVAGALGVEAGWSEGSRASDELQGIGAEAAEADRREVVSAIQQALNERGYKAGAVDGVLAPRTRAAIEAYQADAGLPVTGELSAPLLERLGLGDLVSDELAADEERLLSGHPPERAGEAWPWRELIVHDAFRSGEYGEEPGWIVDGGRFFIGDDHTLRSVVGVEHGPDEGATAGEPDLAEVATAVLGAVLEGAWEAPVGPIGALEIAEIYLAQEISPAFAIELDVRVLHDEGGMALGPYAGERRERGYRLIYIGANEHRLELREMEGERSRLLASHPADVLAKGAVHSVLWTLAPDGPMVVELDGEEIMRVEDLPAAESFEGFTMQNFGGDYALHRIAIYGAG